MSENEKVNVLSKRWSQHILGKLQNLATAHYVLTDRSKSWNLLRIELEGEQMPWEKQFDIEEVLGKAMQAFWCRGYEATSMQDLVRATGVNRASLYATFADKHTLYIAALKFYDEKVRQQLLSELEANSSPSEGIRKIFDIFVAQACDEGSRLGCFINNSALELSAHDAQAAEIIAQAQVELEAFFLRMIERGQATGEIRSSLNASRTASGLLASLLGLFVLVRSRPDRKLLNAIVEECVTRLG